VLTSGLHPDPDTFAAPQLAPRHDADDETHASAGAERHILRRRLRKGCEADQRELLG
jgi:hypothetical protein